MITMDRETAYCIWKDQMCHKGYGSYEEIDKKVASGELKAFEIYPHKTKED